MVSGCERNSMRYSNLHGCMVSGGVRSVQMYQRVSTDRTPLDTTGHQSGMVRTPPDTTGHQSGMVVVGWEAWKSRGAEKRRHHGRRSRQGPSDMNVRAKVVSMALRSGFAAFGGSRRTQKLPDLCGCAQAAQGLDEGRCVNIATL